MPLKKAKADFGITAQLRAVSRPSAKKDVVPAIGLRKKGPKDPEWKQYSLVLGTGARKLLLEEYERVNGFRYSWSRKGLTVPESRIKTTLSQIIEAAVREFDPDELLQPGPGGVSVLPVRDKSKQKVTFRLSPPIEAKLEKIASSRNLRKADVVETAIRRVLAGERYA